MSQQRRKRKLSSMDLELRAIARRIRSQEVLRLALAGLTAMEARAMFEKLKPYLKFEAVTPA